MLSPRRKTFFPGKSRPIDLAQGEDVPVPGLERIDVAPRPLRRPAEAAELDRVRGVALPGQVAGQEVPAGRVGPEAVDEEEDGFGRARSPASQRR